MITVLRKGTTQAQMENLISWLRTQGLDVHISQGHDYTILGLIGDTSRVDMELLASLDIVESVKRVTEPFKQCNRQFHPEDTVVEVGNVKIGGGSFCMIAGPCSVETEEQIIYVAEQGLKGILSKISEKGDLEAICAGTGIMPSLTYYYNRPQLKNDPMGEGPVLRALVEMMDAPKYTEIKAEQQYDRIVVNKN